MRIKCKPVYWFA